MTGENVGQPATVAGSGGSNRTSLIAGAAVGLILCAVVGATGGYLLAGGGETPDRQAGTAATTTVGQPPSKTARANTPSRTPVRTPSRRPSTAPPIGQIMLPDVVGMDFEKAREELRQHGLGVQFVFGNAGSDRTVASTSPRGNTAVKRGTTVRLTVVGAAPEVTVPDLVGESCRQAARRLVDDGLYPSYPTDDKGTVRKQDPEPGSVLRWNGRVGLYCSAEPDSAPTP